MGTQYDDMSDAQLLKLEVQAIESNKGFGYVKVHPDDLLSMIREIRALRLSGAQALPLAREAVSPRSECRVCEMPLTEDEIDNDERTCRECQVDEHEERRGAAQDLAVDTYRDASRGTP